MSPFCLQREPDMLHEALQDRPTLPALCRIRHHKLTSLPAIISLLYDQWLEKLFVCVFLAVGLKDKQPVVELMQQIVSCSFPVKHTDLFGCSVSGLVSRPVAATHNPACPLCPTQRHSGGWEEKETEVFNEKLQLITTCQKRKENRHNHSYLVS